MPPSVTERARAIFAGLNGLLRTVALYAADHPQTRRALEDVHEALADHLRTHGALTFRFLGDVVLANDRILARESLVYRRFLDMCQAERQIGSVTFTAGLDLGELQALAGFLNEGDADGPAAWAARASVTHVILGPPIQPEPESGEVMARRAYYGSVETLREMEGAIRSQAPITVEHLGALRVYTGGLLERILETPGLALRLASIKSYDEYTLYHSVNVAVISIGLGLVLGLPESMLREVAMAGMLHDLGKIAVPLEILRKPGPLDDREWQVMRRHPALGASLMSRLPGSNRLPMIVAFEHHRRYDGQGYPAGTGWRQHPVSRLTCVADVFDAMTSRRAYKEVIPTRHVCAYIRGEGDRIFDPRLVTIVERMLGQLETRPVALDTA